MRRKPILSALFLALTLWCLAAASQTQNVQITDGPKTENVAGDTATVTWSTNVPAGSTVRYGTDANKLEKRAQDSWGGTNHKIQLKGLQPNTTYYYQVRSAKGLGTGSGITSPVGTFTTTGATASSETSVQGTTGSTDESKITAFAGPIVQRLRDTSAQLWWQTDSKSSTILQYGADPNNLADKKEQPWGQASHTIELSGLQPGTIYYYQVVTSNGRTLARSSFKTLTAQEAQRAFQITHGPAIEKLAADSVTVAWTTSAPSSSVVKYGTDPSNLDKRAEAEWGQKTHRVIVTGLSPDTTYYFQVETGQAQGTGQSLASAIFPAKTTVAGAQARIFDTR